MRNGSRPAAEPPDDDALDRAFGDFIVEGEVVSLPERLVVSPARGRFRREALAEGTTIEEGALIGAVVHNGSAPHAVCSPVAGVFLGWMAFEGEILEKGAMLVRIGSMPTANGNGRPKASAPSKNGVRRAKP